MAGAVEPGSCEIEWRPWPVGEPEHVLIEMHRLFEFPGRYIVVVKHTPTLIFISFLLALVHGSLVTRRACASPFLVACAVPHQA